ncbi:hypothetical protein R1sor_024805 [Riccia sorocarpa]|uniref:EF-hand domain-containing protein n=1 Tax=Riccia sorocarpa TaxID=122646 RepID=A0ABD3GVI5_9MARC
MADFECVYPTSLSSDVASWFRASNADSSFFYQAPAEQPSYDSNCQALRRFMSRLGYHLTQNEAQNMLENVDGNQDGRIDFSEFLSLYRSLCDREETTTSSITAASIPTSYASTAYASTPTSKFEISMEVERMPGFEDDSTLLEAFRVFDKNQDGVITPEELQSVLLDLGMPEGRSLRSCEQMIESVDADGNGVIDISEFRQLMTTSLAFA